MHTPWTRVPVIVAGGVILATLLLAVLSVPESGLDYFGDGSAAVDALVRRDWDGFFHNQPLMGPLSLVLRAPFVALVFDASEPTVYWIGTLPCLAALGALAVWLHRQTRDRSDAERLIVLAAVVINPITIKALHWGHPEEILGTALAVAAVLAAGRDRAVLAGLLLGLAIATKQWGVIAGVPTLIALRSGHVRMVLVAGAVTVLCIGPLVLGDPDRFWKVTQAAASTEPVQKLNGSELPGGRTHVTPNNVYWPFSSHVEERSGPTAYAGEFVARVSHPLIVLLGPVLGLILWRRRGVGRPQDALALMALLFLARGALDPMSLDYYHLPALTALGALAAVGGHAERGLALWATAGLAVVFAEPALSLYEVSEHAWPKSLAYLAVCLALMTVLGRRLFGKDLSAPSGP
jgi:hypothetical protein